MKKMLLLMGMSAVMLLGGIVLVGCDFSVGLSHEWLYVTMAEDSVPLNSDEFTVDDFQELELRRVMRRQTDSIHHLFLAIDKPSSRAANQAVNILNNRDDVFIVRRAESYVNPEGGIPCPNNTSHSFSPQSLSSGISEERFLAENRYDMQLTIDDIWHAFSNLQNFIDGKPDITNQEITAFWQSEIEHLSRTSGGNSSVQNSTSNIPGTPEFHDLLLSRFWDAPFVLLDMAAAQNTTPTYYLPSSGGIYGSGGNHLCNGDAFRHAYWNALMVRSIGFNAAALFATAYEGQIDPNDLDQKMDLLNNEIGRLDGSRYRDLSFSELQERIMVRISLGYYIRMKDANGTETSHQPSNRYFLRPQFHAIVDQHINTWFQPYFTSNTSHGTITTNGTPHNDTQNFMAFSGNPANQWEQRGTSGWIQLQLNSYINIQSIEFIQRSSSVFNRTKDAYFTGANGVHLGAGFTGGNSDDARSVIQVGGVVTNVIRLNITSSHGGTFLNTPGIGAREIIIHATKSSYEEFNNQQTWIPPMFTSNSNSHGTITTSGTPHNNTEAFMAFSGNPANQWEQQGTQGWIRLQLNYFIYVHSIEFVQRSSTVFNRTKDAHFTGIGGVRLGAGFTGGNSDGARTIIPVGGIATNVITLNITSSHGGTFLNTPGIGAREIIIHGTRAAPRHDVRFEHPSGFGNIPIVTTVRVIEGETAVFLHADPHKLGNIFMGWSLDGVNVVNLQAYPIFQNTTFVAVFGLGDYETVWSGNLVVKTRSARTGSVDLKTLSSVPLDGKEMRILFTIPSSFMLVPPTTGEFIVTNTPFSTTISGLTVTVNNNFILTVTDPAFVSILEFRITRIDVR